MSATPQRIRTGVVPIETWTPPSDGAAVFRYLDIGSVDRETKTVLAPTELPIAAAPSRARQVLRADDVLVSTVRPNLNAVAIVPSELDGAVGSTGFTVLRAKQDRLLPRYLFHWVRTPMFVSDMTKKATGASYPAVSDRVVLDSIMPLPEVEEQRRIADILDKSDTIRRKRKEAIVLTELLLRSAFLEMFGDPVTNPKGWPVRPLGEMAHQVSDGTHKTPTYRDSGVPFLSAKNVRAHRIDWVNTRFISRSEHQELIKRCLPQRGDVLLTKSGTIGEAAVVERDCEFSLFESVALLKLKRDVLSPAVAAALLNNPSVRRLYGADVKGVGVKHLHLVDIRRLPTICPPRNIQHHYECFEQGVRSNLERHEHSSVEAESLFRTLVAQVFGRKLDSLEGAC